MPVEIDKLPLAAEFPTASEEAWRKLVDGVLKGAPFEKLVSKTYDGLTIAPIYNRGRDAHVIAGRAAAAPWPITQRIDHPDAAMANAQALDDLQNGATGLTLVFAGSAAARGFGLPETAEALARALDGVYLDMGIAIDIEPGASLGDLPRRFAALLDARAVKPADVDIRFGLDPIGAAAARGGSTAAWPQLAKELTDTVQALSGAGFKGPFAVADGRIVHDAGGAEAQELAFVLAVLVAYLPALESAGIPLEAARGMLYARLAADADQFLTLAKFRALRLLWARVEEACGLTPAPLYIAADTAWRMLTQRDPYVNLLRATIATFSAGLGGANSITVLPHTLALGLPDAFARRLARNTHLILLEESNLARVSDPAAGSGGIEELTRQLCSTAWAQFQEIERAGGAFAALAQNLIQKHIAQVRTARDANIAKRRDVLTGASEFPNLHEEAAAVLAPAPASSPSGEALTVAFDALAPTRLAAAFEQLRDASDAMLEQEGARPKLFLANLGTPADFTARATFAKSFFEAGGIDTLGNDGFADTAALIDAFKASGAKLICLCSSDKVYATQATDAAKALHAAGAGHIYLAGRPGEHESGFRDAGVGTFVFAGCDALATLRAAYANLGKPFDDRG
jgi:methylmalonyl-CoA mutase